MKNLLDVAEEYRDVILDKIITLKHERGCLLVAQSEEDNPEFKELNDQIGHWYATIKMVDEILKKAKKNG